MNSEELFIKLNNLELDKNRIIILSGASLTVQGIIESTNDIDLSCDKDYYDSIDWPIKSGAFDKEIKYKDIFEISNNLYYPNDIININGYNFLTLKKCLEIKLILNRSKDEQVIERLVKIVK